MEHSPQPIRATDPHADVRALCDRVRKFAGAIASLQDRTKVIDAADTLEVLTSAYMVPEEPFDWYQWGHLTRTEKRLAELLRLSFGRSRSKEHLLNALYAESADAPEAKIIDVFICKLRAKLKPTDCPYQIETVWGYGYRLVMREVDAERKAA